MLKWGCNSFQTRAQMTWLEDQMIWRTVSQCWRGERSHTRFPWGAVKARRAVGRNSLLKGWKIWTAQKRISKKPCLLCLLTVVCLFSVMPKWPPIFKPLTVRELLKLLLRKCLGMEVEGANWLSVLLWSGFLDHLAVEKAQSARLPARGSLFKLTCWHFYTIWQLSLNQTWLVPRLPWTIG